AILRCSERPLGDRRDVRRRHHHPLRSPRPACRSAQDLPIAESTTSWLSAVVLSAAESCSPLLHFVAYFPVWASRRPACPVVTLPESPQPQHVESIPRSRGNANRAERFVDHTDVSATWPEHAGTALPRAGALIAGARPIVGLDVSERAMTRYVSGED